MSLSRVLLISLVPLWLAESICAQQTQDVQGSPPVITPGDVWKFHSLLDTSVNMEDFKEPMPLKEALALVMEQFAKKEIDLPILVDVAAFEEENPEHHVPTVVVQFSNPAGEITLREFFREALAQIPTKNATVLHRPGMCYFEITTTAAATRDGASSNILKSMIEIYFGISQRADPFSPYSPIDVLGFDYLGGIRKMFFAFLAAVLAFVAWRYCRSRKTRVAA